MQLAETTPKPGVVDPTAKEISAKIPNHQNVDPHSVGMALLMISGPVDLSIGSTVGATGTMMAVAVHDWTWPAWFGILFAITLKIMHDTERAKQRAEMAPAEPAPERNRRRRDLAG